MTTRRIGWLAGGAAFAGAAVLVLSHASQRPPHTEAPILLAAVEMVVFGAPLAIAVAILVGRIAAVTRGRGHAERFLSFATSGIPFPRSEWGAAMRAELASIDDTTERRRFATSAGWAAIRSGFGRRPWVAALWVGSLAAAGTFALSRLTLAGDRVGILVQTLFLPPLALFLVGALVGWTTGRFRSGIEFGALALLTVFIGIFAVAMAEAVVWFDAFGVYVMDGDAPKRTIGVVDAMLDPVSPTFVVIHLLFWWPYPVLGAALGSAWRARRAGRASEAGRSA